MTDLSRWNFATAFTSVEAAALILGESPESISHTTQLEPIFGRMQQCYEPLESWFLDEVRRLTRDKNVHISSQRPIAEILNNLVNSLKQEKQSRAADRLESVKLSDEYLRVNESASIRKKIFLTEPIANYKFMNQRFNRTELIRWLIAINMKSVYPFDLTLPAQAIPRASRWPWGDHHTDLLGHLEAAMLEHWMNYDPTNNKTAPKNVAVETWLKARGVTASMSKSMATMLRVDDLPPGPRTS